MGKKLFLLLNKAAVRRILIFIAFLVLLALAYTAYKAFGQALDDRQRDWWFIGSFFPRTDDRNMPPILDILSEFGKSPRIGGETYISQLFSGALFTLREAFVAFVVGSIVGLVLAVLLAQSKLAERGVMPWVIVSQTIPLIAITPLVVLWGQANLDFLPWEWKTWMSVSVIASYLTFFPVAVNGVRGLLSPSSEHLELMQSYGASRVSILWKIRFPASLPFLFTAFKLAATAAVVGAIVGEISTGVSGGQGLGKLIFEFARTYAAAPERLYLGVIGAGITGLFAFGLIVLVEKTILNSTGQQIRE